MELDSPNFKPPQLEALKARDYKRINRPPADETLQPARKCPTCNSPKPEMHPLIDPTDDRVKECPDSFHRRPWEAR